MIESPRYRILLDVGNIFRWQENVWRFSMAFFFFFVILRLNALWWTLSSFSCFFFFFFLIKWSNKTSTKTKFSVYRVMPQQRLSSANLKFKISVQKQDYILGLLLYKPNILHYTVYSFFIIFRDRSNGKIDRIAVTLQVKQRELAAAVGRWLTLYNFPNNPYYYILVYNGWIYE